MKLNTVAMFQELVKISIDLCNISSMKKRTMSNILGRQTEPFSRELIVVVRGLTYVNLLNSDAHALLLFHTPFPGGGIVATRAHLPNLPRAVYTYLLRLISIPCICFAVQRVGDTE